MLRRFVPSLPLLSVLLLALVLRVWGLGWGLPTATHYLSYHPDETTVLSEAMGMSVFQGRMLPHFYRYGSLQLYLVLLANTFVYLFGNGALIIRDFAAQHAQWAQSYLVGRWLTVVMGVGTVWAVSALGRRLWGRRAGLCAAMILAIMPLHAQHSHWLTVDVPATFWGTLSLLWAVRLADHDPKPWRAALLSGVFAGLAAATKYNLALTLLPLTMALLIAPPSALRGLPVRQPSGSASAGLGWRALASREGFFALAGAVLTFLLACPGAVLDTGQFRHDFMAEADHVRFHPEAEFLDTGSGFVYHVAHNLDAGLGLPLLLLCGFAVGYALWRRERGDGLLAMFALPYYVLIGLAAVRYARYTIPLLPVLALWTGRLLADVTRLPHPILRRAGVAVGVAILLFTLADTVFLLLPMAEPDNRDVALARLRALAPATIGFAAQPWFGTPPVSPWFSAPIPGAWRAQTPPDILARIAYQSDWDTPSLGMLHPPVVVLSEDDYADALRLKDHAALAYISALRREYTEQSVIAGPSDLDAVLTRTDGLPVRGLPSDMRYPNPIISIYIRH